MSRSRCRGVRAEGSDDKCPSSVLFLTRQIQTLKKRVRRYEDQFEQEMHYKVNKAWTRTRTGTGLTVCFTLCVFRF